jgi:hypothetical protein
VSDRTELFLGIIAVATLVMAIVQLGVVIAAGLLVRRLSRLMDQFEQEIRPLIGHLTAAGRDASRAAALATIQVERADQLFADVCTRAEQTLDTVQATILTPLREGRALLNAFRAGLDVIREFRKPPSKNPQAPRKDDETLFI